MWVFEEMVNGKKLTEIINETHCNVKYLPDFTLPDNVVGTAKSDSCTNRWARSNNVLGGLAPIRTTLD